MLRGWSSSTATTAENEVNFASDQIDLRLNPGDTVTPYQLHN